MSRHNPRVFKRPPVGPFRRRGLRVDVEYGDPMTLLDCGDRQVQRDGCFSHPALFRNDGDCIHVFTMSPRLIFGQNTSTVYSATCQSIKFYNLFVVYT